VNNGISDCSTAGKRKKVEFSDLRRTTKYAIINICAYAEIAHTHGTSVRRDGNESEIVGKTDL
jgi:hypothetical protein